MSADAIPVAGGLILSAVGVIATAMSVDIGGTPVSIDGAGPMMIAAGAVLALLGLASSAHRLSTRGMVVTHRHTVDAGTRKIAAKLADALDDDDPPGSA